VNWKKLIGDALRAKEEKEGRREVARARMRGIAESVPDGEAVGEERRGQIAQLGAEVRQLDAEITAADAEITQWRAMEAADAEQDRRSQERLPGADSPDGGISRDGSYRSDGTGLGRTQERGGRTYNERNKQEFLRDLYRFSFGGLDPAAQQRLLAHEQEARDAGQYSERAMSTPTFAGIIPPQYLIDQYALVARAGRPTANVVQHLDLPPSGMSLIVPKGTTGASIGQQTAENTALTTQDQAWSNVTVPVVTAGGYNDISRQSLERAEGIDEIVFNDLVAAYAVDVDQQVLSGTGASGQALGIIPTAGINTASAFAAAATATTFASKVAGQISAIQTTRFLAPSVIIMHPRRWNWLAIQVDGQNRLLIPPTDAGPMNALGYANAPDDVQKIAPQGKLLGLPVVTDASIPTSAGSGPEDQVLVLRREDMLLWEDPAAPFLLRFEQPVGQNLSVRLVAYGYFAFTAGRFPTAVGLVGGNSAVGNGLVAPTF
jgi:HK97 family phage major capsid protein